MKQVLLLSAGNPCRAIVSEAIATKYLPDALEVKIVGAGVLQDGVINQSAIKALEEEGIDITQLHRRELEEVMEMPFDLVITLCDHSKEHCPVFPYAVATIHMGVSVLRDDDKACKEFIEAIKKKLVPLICSELT